MSRPRTAGISNRHALRITTYLHLSTSVSPRVSLPSDCVPRSASCRCQQRGCGPGARGGIPDPAFGDRVHAGRPDVAEHDPDPGLGKDLLECGSEVRSAVAIMNLTRSAWSPRSMIRLRACWAVHSPVGCRVTPRMRTRRGACSGMAPCGARLLDLAWPGQSCGLGSSLSDLLGRLPARALSARLSDGAGRLRPRWRRRLGVRCLGGGTQH
jgi:hypothetical protein